MHANLAAKDNLMNLDLLFYVASATGNKTMYEVAYTHATTTIRELVRSDYFTGHVVVFEPTTGEVIERLTNQGYSHESCWSREQAWGVTGFAQAYIWTRDSVFFFFFLETAIGLSNHFLDRLPESKIPPWDFMPQTSEPRAAARHERVTHCSLGHALDP